MLVKTLEVLALSYLNLHKKIALRKANARGIDVNQPVRLLQEYLDSYDRNPHLVDELVADLLDVRVEDLQPSLTNTPDYRAFRKQVDERLTVFENKPYQLGALDVEIELIVTALCQFKEPTVLEIGVANGYSSAHLYYILDQIGGSITSIDRPRFSTSLTRPSDRIRRWLTNRGRIKNTGTLGDLNPGGVIPIERYAGWLIPMFLRTSVHNVTVYGDAFRILDDLTGVEFDFVVLDAMKPYDLRMKALRMIAARLRPGGLCFLDGYWVNPAFEDFCKQYHFPSWRAGRVGVFSKRPVAR